MHTYINVTRSRARKNDCVLRRSSHANKSSFFLFPQHLHSLSSFPCYSRDESLFPSPCCSCLLLSNTLSLSSARQINQLTVNVITVSSSTFHFSLFSASLSRVSRCRSLTVSRATGTVTSPHQCCAKSTMKTVHKCVRAIASIASTMSTLQSLSTSAILRRLLPLLLLLLFVFALNSCLSSLYLSIPPLCLSRLERPYKWTGRLMDRCLYR